MKRFTADSRIGLNLNGLNKVLPSITSMTYTGRASWLPPINTKTTSTTTAETNGSSTTTTTRLLSSADNTAITTATAAIADMNNNNNNNVTSTPTTTITTIIPIGAPLLFTEETGRIPARFVLGTNKDFLVDEIALHETAKYLGIDQGPIILKDVYHDVMLGPKWKLAAEKLGQWINQVSEHAAISLANSVLIEKN
jgi:hypothetical protein